MKLEYDEENEETEYQIIKNSLCDLRMALKCVGDAIGRLDYRIEQIESEWERAVPSYYEGEGTGKDRNKDERIRYQTCQ